MVRKKTAQEIARDEAWEKCKYEGDEQFEADPFEMFNEGWQAAIASQKVIINTLNDAITEDKILAEINAKLQAEIARLREALQSQRVLLNDFFTLLNAFVEKPHGEGVGGNDPNVVLAKAYAIVAILRIENNKALKENT
jgi:uncharacterized coiled-coil protein SlyX